MSSRKGKCLNGHAEGLKRSAPASEAVPLTIEILALELQLHSLQRWPSPRFTDSRLIATICLLPNSTFTDSARKYGAGAPISKVVKRRIHIRRRIDAFRDVKMQHSASALSGGHDLSGGWSAKGGPLPFRGDAGRQVSGPNLPSTPSQQDSWISRSAKASDSAFLVIYTISAFSGRGWAESTLVRIARLDGGID
jgi:hypothetical protein